MEDALNVLSDAEADRLCQADRYERTEARKDTRAGFHQRRLHTRVGQVRLKVPKLRSLPFESVIIEGYKRRGDRRDTASLRPSSSLKQRRARIAAGSPVENSTPRADSALIQALQ
jgi:hypothetical protein